MNIKSEMNVKNNNNSIIYGGMEAIFELIN
uniref:Uncharacterized protein n=1 Tax=Arundo donax TaxID=35708 RepID=A0A0A9E2U2_ARUDO